MRTSLDLIDTAYTVVIAPCPHEKEEGNFLLIIM